jgi:hypothetical protein
MPPIQCGLKYPRHQRKTLATASSRKDAWIWNASRSSAPSRKDGTKRARSRWTRQAHRWTAPNRKR